jgi:hypothetical protein
MRPVEAMLTPTGRPGEYRGDLEFTMAGPWRVAVQADGGHEPISGAVMIDVALEPEPAPPVAAAAGTNGAVVALDMDAPEGDRSYSPWHILFGAIALTLGIEGFAVARKIRAARRSRAAAPVFRNSPGLDSGTARARGKV